MAQKRRISLNQPMTEVRKEQVKLQQDGYVVVGQYGNDYDIGIILEYSKGADKVKVMARHAAYIQERVKQVVRHDKGEK